LIARLGKSLESRDYRWLWSAHFLFVVSLVMYRLTLGWLVLNLTNSALWVGIAAGMDGLGKILFGIVAGVLVDRLEKRRVLILAQLTFGLLAMGLGALIVLKLTALWLALAVAFLLGALDALVVPANSAMVYQTVGRERMMNAAAVNMLGFNLARTLGAALAGNVMDGWGEGVCLVLTGAFGCAASLPLLGVRGVFPSVSSSHEPFWETLREGVQSAWRDGALRRVLGLSVIVELFGFSHYTMIPVMARDVLQVGATGLGYLTAASGLGATAGTLLLAGLGDVKRKGALLWGATTGGAVSLIAFALSPWYALSLALSALAGGLLAGYDALMQTVVQLLTPDAVRGRVLSLYVLTFGFTSVGGYVAGLIATLAGAPFAIGLGGGIMLAYLLSVTRTLRALRAVS
jgi:MFS family permease